MSKKNFGNISSIIKSAHNDAKPSNVKEISLSEIDGNEENFFSMERDAEYLALLESIKTNGLIHPIAVLRNEGRYTVISGHRRLKAVRETGGETIACAVIQFDSPDSASLAMIDANLTARTLKPIEITKAIKMIENIIEQNPDYAKGKTRDYIGSLLGISGAQVQRYKAIDHLNGGFRKLIEEERIAMSTAELFASLPPNKQDKALAEIEAKLEEGPITRDDAQEIKKALLYRKVTKTAGKNVKISRSTWTNLQKYCKENKLDAAEFIEKAVSKALGVNL